MSFICCGMFIFLTADKARAGAAAMPACGQTKNTVKHSYKYEGNLASASTNVTRLELWIQEEAI